MICFHTLKRDLWVYINIIYVNIRIHQYVYIYINVKYTHLHHPALPLPPTPGTEAHRANCAKVKWLRSSPAAEPQAFCRGSSQPNHGREDTPGNSLCFLFLGWWWWYFFSCFFGLEKKGVGFFEKRATHKKGSSFFVFFL